MKTAIIGGPRVGKTTLSGASDRVLHADDHIAMGWSRCSAHVAKQMRGRKFDTFEGVAVVRALRKALASSKRKPVDEVVYLKAARETLTPGQAAMAKGVDTVFRSIVGQLRKRGVKVVVYEGEAP